MNRDICTSETDSAPDEIDITPPLKQIAHFIYYQEHKLF